MMRICLRRMAVGLLVVFAAAFAFAAFCLARVPSRPLTALGGTHPFRALRYARSDRVFRQTLISWMFLGFATLMVGPLRVEYLANPTHGPDPSKYFRMTI